jgi:hypothetical protein
MFNPSLGQKSEANICPTNSGSIQVPRKDKEMEVPGIHSPDLDLYIYLTREYFSKHFLGGIITIERPRTEIGSETLLFIAYAPQP